MKKGGRDGVGKGREGGRGANNKYHNRDSGFYFGIANVRIQSACTFSIFLQQ